MLDPRTTNRKMPLITVLINSAKSYKRLLLARMAGHSLLCFSRGIKHQNAMLVGGSGWVWTDVSGWIRRRNRIHRGDSDSYLYPCKRTAGGKSSGDPSIGPLEWSITWELNVMRCSIWYARGWCRRRRRVRASEGEWGARTEEVKKCWCACSHSNGQREVHDEYRHSTIDRYLPTYLPAC